MCRMKTKQNILFYISCVSLFDSFVPCFHVAIIDIKKKNPHKINIKSKLVLYLFTMVLSNEDRLYYSQLLHWNLSNFRDFLQHCTIAYHKNIKICNQYNYYMYISKSSCLLMLFYINKDEMHTAFYVREAQKKQREETVEVHQGYQAGTWFLFKE